MQYGLQMYSIRDMAAENYESALKTVAEMGYDMVESAGFFGHTAAEIGAMLTHYGLTLCSTHTGFKLLTDDFDGILAFHKAVGCTDIILPSIPFSTKEDLDHAIACINRWQPMVEAEGMRLHFHNHSGEFLPNKDGLIAIDELAARTDILFEIDTFWATNAGLCAVDLMEKYRARLRFIHLKDGIPANPADPDSRAVGRSLGLGTTPVAEIRGKAIEMGLTMVVESEDLDPSGEEEVRRCITHLRALDAADAGVT